MEKENRLEKSTDEVKPKPQIGIVEYYELMRKNVPLPPKEKPVTIYPKGSHTPVSDYWLG